MPSPGPMARNSRVEDVLALDDAQLVEYMKQNPGPNGGFELDPEGWEELSEQQREQLAKRLKQVLIGAQKVNDAVTSRPVDADQLAARLNGIADKQDVLPQALFRQSRYERTPTIDVDWEADAKNEETIAYNALIKDGGRPVYPISRLDEVFEGLEEYHEMLRPWYQMGSDFGRNVFRLQLSRWKLFRRWQHDNREPDEEKDFAAYLEEWKREDAEGTIFHPTPSQYLEELRDRYERRQLYYGHDDGEEGFAAYVEEKKQSDVRHGSTWPGMTVDEHMQALRHRFKARQEFNKRQGGEVFEDSDEGFMAFVKKDQEDDIIAGRKWPGMTEDQYSELHRRKFNREQDEHYWRGFYWLRDDHGRGGFSEYVAEAERRLARHGFTKAFEFDRDPTRQDKLTTWIEYLNYEYSWLDRHTRIFTKLQPDYDKAWQKLVDSGVLRHGETAATLSTLESVMRRINDLDAGEPAVHRAKQEGKQVEEQVSDAKSKSKLPEPLRRRMVKQATARIEAAQAYIREMTKRCGLISRFLQGVANDYDKIKEELTLERIRVQWAREQMPLIEAEVAGNCLRTRRKTKRRLEDDQCDEEANDRSPKRKKQSHETASLSDDAGSSASTETVEPTVTRTTKRRAGGATTGLKPSRGSQSQSSAIPPQAPKQLRRSSRFATAQDKPGDTVRPSGGGRWWLRSHCKTASVTAPHT